MNVDIASVRASAAKAALNPALWPETLWQVSQLIGGDMTLLEHFDKKTGAVALGFTDRPDLIAAMRDSYERHYFAVNPRAWSLPPHEVAHDDLLGDERTLGQYEFYVDFLKSYGLKYFIGMTAAEDAEQTVAFSLQRSADRGRVGEEERRQFAALLPDIRNATAMYLRMIQAPSGATLAAAFDRLADPLAVVGEDHRLVFANRAMAGLIAAGDIVTLRDHRLVGTRDGANRALREAIGAATVSRRSAMAVCGAPGGRMILRATPLDRADAREFAPAEERLLCLLIDDPARPHWPTVEGAMRLFGLTRREATVGTHLAAGLTTDEIARRLSLSRNTIRSHLAMLRDKIGVRNSIAIAAEMRRAAGPFA